MKRDIITEFLFIISTRFLEKSYFTSKEDRWLHFRINISYKDINLYKNMVKVINNEYNCLTIIDNSINLEFIFYDLEPLNNNNFIKMMRNIYEKNINLKLYEKL